MMDNLKQDLDNLNKKIQSLEKEISEIEEAMTDEAINYEELNELFIKKENLSLELENTMEAWVEINM